MWLVMVLLIALATLLAMFGWAACVVGGARDADYDEGDYADEAGDELP